MAAQSRFTKRLNIFRSCICESLMAVTQVGWGHAYIGNG
jgi:hypothetical protein